MDPNSTGRERPTFSEPASPPARPPVRPDRPGSGNSKRRRSAILAALVGAVIIVLVGASIGGSLFGSSSPSPLIMATRPATPPVADAATATPGTSPSPTPRPADSATPAPTATPLPALVGAIGDSYSQAWSVSPDYLRDHPQFSWVVGTAKSDGVYSLLERFRALGAAPTVVDAATSGRKMDDAPRQADAVVAAAAKLAPGQTAFVTFELGTNDLCASPDPMTDPAEFTAQLQAAVAALRTGLPAGSRILMLPVPDFAHFREITQADAAARALLSLPANLDRCAPYLGASSPAAIAQAGTYLARYDASIESACMDINAREGATGRLTCTYDASRTDDSDFTIDDLSSYDFFHPSLSGQQKMAADAWQTEVWASLPLPPAS
jgi:lysophospholipase L1-like esterase